MGLVKLYDCDLRFHYYSMSLNSHTFQVYTMPEYLEKRYGGQRLRIAMSVISMILYVLTKIAVDMYAGALFIQLALGINLYLAVGEYKNNLFPYNRFQLLSFYSKR